MVNESKWKIDKKRITEHTVTSIFTAEEIDISIVADTDKENKKIQNNTNAKHG